MKRSNHESRDFTSGIDSKVCWEGIVTGVIDRPIDMVKVGKASAVYQMRIGRIATRASMFTWFIQTVGFWGMLTLATAIGVFLGSCIAVVRSPNVLPVRSCCIVLSIPLLVGLVAGVVNGLSTFESIRKIADDLELTRFDIAIAVVQSMWVPLFDAVVLTAPTFLVLVVGRLIRARSIVKKIEPH